MTDNPTTEQVAAATDVELCRYVELYCFGDDGTANTDEDIVYAIALGFRGYVTGWVFNGNKYPEGGVLENLDEMTIWHNRHGQPWQSDLEAHVAAWRAEPRDFSDHGILKLLKDEIHRRGWQYDLTGQTATDFVGAVADDYGHAICLHAETEWEALCRAAVLACMQSEEE